METLIAHPTTAVGGIDLRGVTRSFGEVHAVRGIDLAVAPGEIVALLGPNGAGKSTTIDIILGLLEADGGDVTLFGQQPRAAIADGCVGAMLQTGSLVRDLTVRELVDMTASLYAQPLPVDDVLFLSGTASIADRRTQTLSGGEAQRTRFAVAVVADPDLLVLDEPTVGLDVEARREFWATIRGFATRGRTVLFATHYLEEADAFADRIVLMAEGRIVADGSSTSIKSLVHRRRIRATLPVVEVAELGRITGVVTADRRGDVVELMCTDGDTALRQLLARYPAARDLEVGGADLEEAFLQLTGRGDERPIFNDPAVLP